MCQQIVQFCTGSARPLLYVGAFFTFVSAVSLGYLSCSTNALYQDVDSKVADSNSIYYYLQLLSTAYLVLLTAFICFAAHYDQKHSTRALASLTTINFIITLVAILMLQNGKEIEGLFGVRLKQALDLYDYKPANPAPKLNAPLLDEGGKNRSTRMVFSNELSQNGTIEQALSREDATLIWDKLQSRGCCGFRNHTEWNILPKSCCSTPIEENGKQLCREVDSIHQKACKDIFRSFDFYLLVLLALIALINLYLATVTGVSTYRTLSYNEASQSAYT